ncbi:MAG: MBL fold metallo-hydrolase [Candidatus Eremiobacteraeota bacterium]|nr:MBL fold metallo-hydrolase [Candidatus Eremiobacteraeota bacterium]
MVRLVRAPNPSLMTLTGTNSYLLDCGNGEAICIDPGPAIPQHVDALLNAAREHNLTIALICVTHGHPDHAPGAQLLTSKTNAPVAAHPHAQFPHSRTLNDSELIEVGEARLRCIDAPGHTFDHLVFYEERERALFTGDVVLGEGTVVIAPPSGAMRPYQATLERLARECANAARIYGGHGEMIADPAAKLREYIAHRKLREQQLLLALSQRPRTIPELVKAIYAGTNLVLWPAAARQILAYLIALEDEGRVRSSASAQPISSADRAMLNPDWAAIVGAESAAVAQAELGGTLELQELRTYETTA